MAFGILGAILCIVSGVFKNPRATMACAFGGGVTYMAYYIMLGIHAPLVSIGLGLIVTTCALSLKNDRLVDWVCYVITVAICAVILINMTSVYDLLIVAGEVLYVLAYISRKNYIPFKSYMVAHYMLWILYCIPHADWPMFLTCAFTLVSHAAVLLQNMAKDDIRISDMMTRRKRMAVADIA